MKQVREKEAIKWLFKIFEYAPFRFIGFTAIRILCYAGLGILPSIVIREFFDSAAENRLTHNLILRYFILLVLIQIVQAVAYHLDLELSYGWVEVNRGIFRKNILMDILRRGKVGTKTQGNLINIIRSDINTPIDLMWNVPYFMAFLVFSFVGAFIMASMDWQITIILFLPLLIVFILVNQMKNKIAKYYTKQQQATDEVITMIGSILDNNGVIKGGNAQGRFLQRLEGLGNNRMKAAVNNSVVNSLLSSVYENVVNIGTGILLILASQKIKNNTFTIGDFTLFVALMGYTSNLTRTFGNVLSGYKRTEVSYERIKSVLPEDTFQTLTKKSDLFTEKIEQNSLLIENRPPFRNMYIKDLTYHYVGSIQGIEEISLEIKANHFYVLLGKVGSGKTTLLEVLLHLLPKESGEFYWNDRVMESSSDFFVPPHVAYTPQEAHFISGTIRENITLGLPVDEQTLEEAVRLAALEEDISCFEQGLDTIIGTDGLKLSGGQKQRLAAARMFVRKSDIWILDNATSALDKNTEITFWRRVKKYTVRHQIACVVVSNRKTVLEKADMIIQMESGRIVNRGSYAELCVQGQLSE